MLYSNNNVVVLPMSADGKYKIGDKYKCISSDWREKRFDNLEIKNIDYSFGVRLHFDYQEWYNNNPKNK